MCHTHDGRDGRDGRDGLNGLNGRDGYHGKKGDTGSRGRDGRDGRDGIDGINGIDGDNGEIGAQGCQGARGAQGQSCQSRHFNTSVFSFTGTNGIPGISYKSGAEILNILNRANMPITYIGIIWSSSESIASFQIDIRDVSNITIQRLIVGPSAIANSKNVYEIHLNPLINSSFTRLLRFIILKNISIFSIMIAH
jgi:hypothetical protein